MPVQSEVHRIRPQQVYGLTNPVHASAPQPIIVGRPPQVSDQSFLGTLWVDPVNVHVYVLAAIVANQSQWLLVA
jgi:hypothetical protein